MKTSYKLLWILFAVILLSSVSIATAVRMDLSAVNPVDGDGVMSERIYEDGEFEGFEVYGGVDVALIPSDSPYIKVITDQNLQDLFYVKKRDGWFTISRDAHFGHETNLEVYVYTPGVIGCSAHNSSTVRMDSVMKVEELEVRAHNSSQVYLFSVTKNLTVKSRNSSEVFVKGETEDLDIRASASSKVECTDMISRFAKVSSEGSSDVKVRVSDRLETDIHGGSTVWYIGPENLPIKSSGSAQAQPISRPDPS